MNERETALDTVGDGLLGDYVSYARTLTGAPLMFHVATGLSILSATVGSRVSFVGAGDVEYWPNIYALILAPSGLFKTTAINLGLRILDMARPGIRYPDQYSVEKLVGSLADQPNRLLEVEEFATLLADMEKSYMGGLKELLTKLYDPRETFTRALVSGTITITRPSISILGASTASWLARGHLTYDDFVSGFMPRFLLFPSDLKEPEPDGGILPHVNRAKKQDLISQVRYLGEMMHRRPPGPNVTFTNLAIKDIMNLQAEIALKVATSPVPDELDGLYNRTASHAAKLSTLLTVSDQGCQHEYEVDVIATERACGLLRWILESSQRVFETEVVLDKHERALQSILSMLPMAGMPYSDALRLSKKSSREFRELVGTLTERRQIRLESQSGDSEGTSGRVIIPLRLED